ncbi:MAG: enoyl-CoA hydratase/isomerase family protein [Solirubrobacterales bacterium]|nr:enoyl-CoA hydratase/isomerase family protein [Solirubrobacterales bacterium]
MRAVDLQLETWALDQEGRVLTARYSNPPFNYVGTTVIRELNLLTRAVERDPSIGAVVLTGGVEGQFLTHADPAVFAGMLAVPHPPLPLSLMDVYARVQNVVLRIPGLADAVEKYGGGIGAGLAWGYRWKRAILRMNRSSTVYIAAINGPALGGGHELALACDLRYAADSEDLLLGQIESVVGLIPGGGGTQRLARMVGTGHALEHILEGVPLTASDALELGFVHRLVPKDELVCAAQAIGERLARRSPATVAAIKRCVYFGTDRRLSGGLDLEQAGIVAAGSARVVPEVLRAFLEDQERLGDTPFLRDAEPWIEGTRIDQVGT